MGILTQLGVDAAERAETLAPLVGVVRDLSDRDRRPAEAQKPIDLVRLLDGIERRCSVLCVGTNESERRERVAPSTASTAARCKPWARVVRPIIRMWAVVNVCRDCRTNIAALSN